MYSTVYVLCCLRLFKLKTEIDPKQYKQETSPKVTKLTNRALNSLALVGESITKITYIFWCELGEGSQETRGTL